MVNTAPTKLGIFPIKIYIKKSKFIYEKKITKNKKKKRGKNKVGYNRKKKLSTCGLY